ncbi:lipid IV(A) 3-deoxy-D-manno-octulosonic acid transferase [Nitratiruptor sp. YY09-18]|uniref:lipid IV(A) 3-deoxy-D-manno-octulosonic acid transferase n=1 Tax=Nitratiruptor sp. YY09-18 TaxID=2724901 RepID=UPI001915D4D0|nr:lipid IV(A) 3-deoxy-D-manno-octulosonic acid transferase [Nitratiruptor sp. YY09-18]BCD68608.1 3-deoxy-D-manno-octulosonic-acid transferase [Nitratiruptor sp. YY09-18]
MFTYLYTLITLIAYILAIPILLLLALKKKYRQAIPARFFLINNPPFSQKLIHFHACSLGETKALAPLVQKLEKCNISVITQTGFAAASSYPNAQVRYLPFEPLLWVWLKPQKALVVMEAELWYLLFYISKKRGAKTILLNARISDRSLHRYMRFIWFYKRVFAHIDYVFAQTKEDAKRLEQLGAKNIEVIGNIKLLSIPQVTKKYEKSRPIIVAASTHDPEEEIIATEWVVHQKGKSTLVVAPRHPERFDEVAELLEHIAAREDLTFSLLSQTENLEADIILIDKLGELNNLYAVADLVILGGSFVESGGHNPLEPAYFGAPIVSGPYYFNQKESYAYVEGIEVVPANDLGSVLQHYNWKKSKIVADVSLDPVWKVLEDVV